MFACLFVFTNASDNHTTWLTRISLLTVQDINQSETSQKLFYILHAVHLQGIDSTKCLLEVEVGRSWDRSTSNP
jgi:hypothetical protein